MYWNWEKKAIERDPIRRKQIFKTKKIADVEDTKKKIKIFPKRSNERNEIVYEKLNDWGYKFKQWSREVWDKQDQ